MTTILPKDTNKMLTLVLVTAIYFISFETAARDFVGYTANGLQEGDRLRSRNGEYTAQLRADGNLVISTSDKREFWSTGLRPSRITNTIPTFTPQNRNCVWVLSRRSNGVRTSVWSTKTWVTRFPRWDDATCYLALSNEGRLELITGGQLSRREVVVVGYNGETNGQWVRRRNSVIFADSELNVKDDVLSDNGKYTLTMQEDGNLVIYDSNSFPVWSTDTHVNPGAVAKIDRYCNLTIVKDHAVIWDGKTGDVARSSDTCFLQLTDTGRLYTHISDKFKRPIILDVIVPDYVASTYSTDVLSYSGQHGQWIQNSLSNKRIFKKKYNSLTVGTFNAFLIPVGGKIRGGGQTGAPDRPARAYKIGSAEFFKQFDILILNELFEEHSSNMLLDELKSTYWFRTPLLKASSGSVTKFMNGGVRILSKYPMSIKQSLIFKSSCGWDSSAEKGAWYVKIDFNGAPVHVIGTHLQADDEKCNIGDNIIVRTAQLRQILSFIEKKKIPKDELVLIGGDLNVTYGSEEYNEMVKLLGIEEPHKYTGHSTTTIRLNKLAKGDSKPKHEKRLDYIFMMNNDSNVRYFNHTSTPQDYNGKDDELDIYSDHLPVTFSFETR